MRSLLITIIALLISTAMVAQDLDCSISVNSQQVEGTDREVYTNLQKALYEFMNNTKWTPYQIELNERMNMVMLVTITERVSDQEFKAQLNIVMGRPTYNTGYTSPIFNYLDKDFKFTYSENEPLMYDQNSFMSNLTSVMAFYVNYLYGLYFDSFTSDGGTMMYSKAQATVNMSQSSGMQGWRAFDGDKNRYWLVENIQNPAYGDLRSFLYQYHLKGMDIMEKDIATGRAGVLQALQMLEKVKEERPGLFTLNLFIEAKRSEIIQIFKEAPMNDKQRVVEIMKGLDPAKGSEYERILE